MVTVSDDVIQGQWPGVGYRSRDGGESWIPVGGIRSVSHASVPINGGEALLLIPYELYPLNRTTKNSAQAEGTILTFGDNNAVHETPQVVTFKDFPCDFGSHPGGQLRMAASLPRCTVHISTSPNTPVSLW